MIPIVFVVSILSCRLNAEKFNTFKNQLSELVFDFVTLHLTSNTAPAAASFEEQSWPCHT